MLQTPGIGTRSPPADTNTQEYLVICVRTMIYSAERKISGEPINRTMLHNNVKYLLLDATVTKMWQRRINRWTTGCLVTATMFGFSFTVQPIFTLEETQKCHFKDECSSNIFTCLTFQSKEKQIQETQEFVRSSQKLICAFQKWHTFANSFQLLISAIETTKQRRESAPGRFSVLLVILVLLPACWQWQL